MSDFTYVFFSSCSAASWTEQSKSEFFLCLCPCELNVCSANAYMFMTFKMPAIPSKVWF